MKIYNRTRIPTALLRPALSAAARSMGARSGGVVVLINPARYWSGLCTAADLVRRGRRWVSTDSAFVTLRAPRSTRHGGPLYWAVAFIHLARHEFGHVKDRQTEAAGQRLPYSRDLVASGQRRRRPAHESPDRVEERRVDSYLWKSDREYGPAFWAPYVRSLAVAALRHLDAGAPDLPDQAIAYLENMPEAEIGKYYESANQSLY